HFTHREDAIDAINALNGKVVDGSPIEVSLAKPVDKDSYVRYTRGTGGRGSSLLQTDYTAYTVGQVYDPSAAYLGAPVFYAPQAYAAIPGQFRFPAAKAHVGGRGLIRTPSVREIYMTVPVGAAGVRGLGGRGYLAYAAGGGAMSRGGGGAGSASYGLKIDKHAEEKLYDLLPGMELTPMSLKAAAIKPAPQVLEELCQKNNWGQPVYQLHSAIGPDQRQLFLYKITVPALATQYPSVHPFTPAKLCAAVEEAKVHAAEHTLQTLGLQTEGAADTSCATAAAVASVSFPGYTLASPASSAVASQLKQAVSLGQDLTAYTTYDGYPAFAVATRHADGYGVF
ncbi:APOBEC1 complementation factor-like, partial [Hippoglossus hippoglossus]|uniref:APOBEC1 complementation factor-like n=1 Tax=Hippoglossus hippoglossus TaxID=8267 RepID=UPI00148D0233